MDTKVIKASGQIENFDEGKLTRSLQKAHIPNEVAVGAIAHAKSRLTDPTSTDLIYSLVQNYLLERGFFGYSFNYDLKRAIMRLGPTGYPFEKFVAKVIATKGYETQVGVILSGKCVSHEVDIEAVNDTEHYFIECKFHNQPGVKTDIQVALYTKARFEDIKSGLNPARHTENHSSWLITNTAVSKEVITYAKCTGMRILSWSYPEEENLRDLIIAAHLHPVTVLRNLTDSQYSYLLQNGIVTINELEDFLGKNQPLANFTSEEIERILTEIKTFV